MSLSFVSNFFRKKQDLNTIVRVVIVCLFIFAFFLAIIHFVSVFMLKFATKNVIDDLSKKGIKIEYSIYSDIFNGNVVVNNLSYQVSTGKINFKTIKVKKTNGLIIPSKVNIIIDKLTSTIFQNKKNYTIEQHGNENGFEVKLQSSFLNKPSFKGISITSPLMYVIIDSNKNVGEIRIDEFAVEINDNKKETKYKGSMNFHDALFLPYVFMLDSPLKWDIHLQEFKTHEYIGFDKSKKVELNNVKVNKFDMDFDFTKLSAKGYLSYFTKIHNIDLEVNIDNDAKFIDSLFNMVLRTKSDSKKQIKMVHDVIKRIVSILKQNNKNSNDKNLQLLIKKTDIMPDYTINGYGVTDLVTKSSTLK